VATHEPTVRTTTRSAAVPRTRHHLTALAAGLALLAGGCAAPASPAAGPATTPVTEPAVAVSETSPEASGPAEPREVRVVIPVVEAATTWVPRTVTAAAEPEPDAAEPPAPVPDPAPDPEPAPAPAPSAPATPPPPDLVVGEDGCVTDRTTGLVVTCYDEAAGPDEE
jgi:hypothetical protein